MRKFLRKIIKSDRGVALIEFAFVTPFMMLLLFGGIEVARYALIIQKVQKASYAMTDIVAQYASPTVPKVPPAAGADKEISVSKLDTEVFPLFDRLMQPFNGTAAAKEQTMVVFTSVVHRANGTNQIRWARINGTLFTDVTSVVTGAPPRNISRAPGTPCLATNFPANVTTLLNAGGADGAFANENFIVGEVFYRYRPIISFLLGLTESTSSLAGTFGMEPRTIARRIYIHPRNDTLLDLPPDSPTAVPPVSNACP